MWKGGAIPEASSSRRIAVVCEIGGQHGAGFVERRDLSRSERALRAAKMLGIFWAVAVFTVFIPVLHFVLVPLFLILGLVFGFTTWMEKGEILSGEVACPGCRHVLRFTREAEDWPKSPRCGGCSMVMTIQKQKAADL